MTATFVLVIFAVEIRVVTIVALVIIAARIRTIAVVVTAARIRTVVVTVIATPRVRDNFQTSKGVDLFVDFLRFYGYYSVSSI